MKVLVTQSRPTLCDPMICSPPGSSVHGFSRREYQSGQPFPSPGDLPNQEPNPGLLHCGQILYCLSHQRSPYRTLLLLPLLLSCFSCVRLCATPQTAAHQVPLSLGFSRKEYWSGLPFPSPGSVAQLCSILCNPQTAARQVPLPMEFCRQGYWSGLPFLTPWDLPDPGIEPLHWQVDSLPLSHWGNP